jgi:hypothetical protein
MRKSMRMATAMATGFLATWAAAAAPARADDAQTLALAGDWTGVLQGEPPTHVIIHVRPSGGGVAATYDNVDRGVREVPLSDFRRDAAAVSFALPQAGIHYEGQLDADGRTLKGSITQGAAPPQPLDLSRAAQGPH